VTRENRGVRVRRLPIQQPTVRSWRTKSRRDMALPRKFKHLIEIESKDVECLPIEYED